MRIDVIVTLAGVKFVGADDCAVDCGPPPFRSAQRQYKYLACQYTKENLPCNKKNNLNIL